MSSSASSSTIVPDASNGNNDQDVLMNDVKTDEMDTTPSVKAAVDMPQSALSSYIADLNGLVSQQSTMSKSYHTALTDLLETFHQSALDLFLSFSEDHAPLLSSAQTFDSRLSAALTGKYIRVSQSEIDQLTGARPSAMAFTSSAISANIGVSRSFDRLNGHTNAAAAPENLLVSHLKSYANSTDAFTASPTQALSKARMQAETARSGRNHSWPAPPPPPPPSSLLLSFIESLKVERVAEHNDITRQLQTESDAARIAQRQATTDAHRAETVLTHLLPVFPLLSLERGIACMKRNNDVVDRCVEELLRKSESDWINDLQSAEDEQQQASLHASSSSELPSSAPAVSTSTSNDTAMPALVSPTSSAARLYRQLSEAEKTLVYQIAAITSAEPSSYNNGSTHSHSDISSAVLHLIPILDRNRMAIDRTRARHMTITATEIATRLPSLHVLNEFETESVLTDAQTRIATVIYQTDGETVSPIHLEPSLKLSEYELHVERGTAQITGMEHKLDGFIQFNAIINNSDNPLLHLAPLVLYTQLLDKHTLHVIHMHVNDLSNDISIDTVNLTDSSQTMSDCYDFTPDATGRELTYRIVAKDGKIVSVLYPSAVADHNMNTNNNGHHGYDQHDRGVSMDSDYQRALAESRGTAAANQRIITSATFNEISVPNIGSLVALSGDRLAKLMHIPLAMLITNAHSNYLDSHTTPTTFTALYPPAGHCPDQHPADMAGYVDVKIVYESGKLVGDDNPHSQMSLPVCRIRTPTQTLLSAYHKAIETTSNDARARFTLLVDELINGTQKAGEERDVTRLTAVRSELTTLMSDKSCADLAAANQTRINDAFTSLGRMQRLAAASRRMTAGRESQ